MTEKDKDPQAKSETCKPEFVDDKYSRLRFFNEIAATVILTISAICVVAAIVIFVIGSSREVVKHEYTYTLKVDTIGKVTPEAQMEVDSIIATIKQHENAISARYEYILEQRENSQNYLTVGGIFVTVIVSIFGFFGYKSFKNIEEDAKKSAEKIAADKAEEIAIEKAENVATKLNNKLNNELKKEQKETLRDFKKEDIPDMVDKAVRRIYGTVVGNKMSNIDEVIHKIPAIETEISELKRANDDENLVKKTTRKKRGRLEDVPGIRPDDINELDHNKDIETAKSEG